MHEKITVEIRTHKTIYAVWEVFTNPEYIVKWNFASTDWHCPKASNDFIVNGAFNYRMESVDGRYGFDFTGKYSKIVPYEEITYELDDKRIVTIEFIKDDDAVIVRETFDAENEHSIGQQESGWQSILNNFKRVVESIEWDTRMEHPDVFFDRYGLAVLQKNKILMKSLYHETIRMFDLWDDFSLEGKRRVCEMIDAWFDSLSSERVHAEFEQVNTRVDEKVAFSDCFIVYKALSDSGAELRHIKERMSVCFVNEGKGWQVVHQHSSIPIRTETGAGVFD